MHMIIWISIIIMIKTNQNSDVYADYGKSSSQSNGLVQDEIDILIKLYAMNDSYPDVHHFIQNHTFNNHKQYSDETKHSNRSHETSHDKQEQNQCNINFNNNVCFSTNDTNMNHSNGEHSPGIHTHQNDDNKVKMRRMSDLSVRERKHFDMYGTFGDMNLTGQLHQRNTSVLHWSNRSVYPFEIYVE